GPDDHVVGAVALLYEALRRMTIRIRQRPTRQGPTHWLPRCAATFREYPLPPCLRRVAINMTSTLSACRPFRACAGRSSTLGRPAPLERDDCATEDARSPVSGGAGAWRAAKNLA